MPTDPATFFIAAILPYVAVVVLIDGLLYRLYRWMRRPGAATRFTIYPAANSLGRALPRLFGDIVLFPRLLRDEKALWIGAWLFHLSLVMIAVSHYKVFFSYIWLWEGLGVSPATFQLASNTFDGATGGVMAASLLFLLGRRFPKFLRKLSDPEDYLVLMLLLAISVSGIYLRFIESLNLLELRRYFQSLVEFSPSNIPGDPVFLAHYILVLILMIYFPLGKLVHTIGAGLTARLIRLGSKYD